MKRRMGDLTRGAAVQGISLGDVKESPILVPPPKLREPYKIAAQTFGKMQSQQQEATREAGRLFDSLLQHAFQTEK